MTTIQEVRTPAGYAYHIEHDGNIMTLVNPPSKVIDIIADYVLTTKGRIATKHNSQGLYLGYIFATQEGW